MIIRCVQRMKQARVHVLIFTELSLYVKCSLGCFLHLINIREVFLILFCFFFLSFLEHQSLFCRFDFCFVSLWVESVLKVAPEKIHLTRPTEVRHWSDADAVKNNLTTVSHFGGSLWTLVGFLWPEVRLAGKKKKKEKKRPSKGTWLNGSWSRFVHGTMMALESDL